ncbi:hypothetical protein JKF63_04834 [Porcisia hertigi]|uniref:Uncharacterized protein n=1 Tax=Porcisia hertigi TaxID=2761500 RepID=A0A836LHY1_9TRYP|nr:hypothetical protein JKF63_04834 [Porcisia hertigi]
MEIPADLVDRGLTDTARTAVDPYDERHRQANALATWERQKEAWRRMQKHLVAATTTTTTSSRAARKGGASKALNFTEATPAARAKREDFGLLFVARPDTPQKGSFAWEGMLRCTDARLARRLVPIGRTAFPYRLHSEVRDPGMLPDDHMLYARVVSEGDVAAAENTTPGPHTATSSTLLGMQQRAVAQSRVRATTKSPVDDASKGITGSRLTCMVPQNYEGKGAASYYEYRLRQFFPYLQERLNHFLQPRTFLQVEGHRAPYASAEEPEAQKHEWTAARPLSASGVEFYLPPPQTQMWASIPASALQSRTVSTLQPTDGARKGVDSNSVAVGSVPSHDLRSRSNVSNHNHAADADDKLVGDAAIAIESTSGGTLSDTTMPETPYDASPSALDGREHETSARKSKVVLASPLHPLRVKRDGVALRDQPSQTGGVEGEERVQTPGPAVELSTHSLFFETRPHELLQGTVTLYNTGTTTIYYSLMPVNVVEEHLRRSSHDSGVTTAANGKVAEPRPREEWNGREGRQHMQDEQDGVTATSITHTLAVHQRIARETFFPISSPMDGVVLPGEDGVFAFSVRANRPGLFQHTYELLTVPPAPLRIFIRLRALVRRDQPSWEWLAAPVAQAIEAKVAVDAQRRLVQTISLNDTAIEQSALSAHIKTLDEAADVARAAERKRRRAQEDAWHIANRFTFDYIPYVAAVYDKLEQLYTVVQEVYCRLSKSKVATGTDASIFTLDKVPSVFDTTVKQSASPAALRTEVTSPQQDPTQPAAGGPAQWDGSLLLLVQQMMLVRDTPTRQMFFDAFLVLLRAARASRQRTSSSVSAENIDQESPSLPTLLTRAAEALADSVHDRRAAMLERECENILGKRLTAASTNFMQSFAATSGAHTLRSAGAPTDPAKASSSSGLTERTHSGNSKKRTVTPRGKGAAAAAATSADGPATFHVPSQRITEVTKAQRIVLDSIPTEELLGFSAIQADPKSAAVLEAMEKVTVHAQRELELKAERDATIKLYTAQFLEVIDVACGRGPLSACTAARLAELEDIQTSRLLPIDLSADTVLPLTTGKGNKRK